MTPQTISLPSGPGSIEGLGPSFQPMLNTGTARYSVRIAVPPGTAGHAPQLYLRYDSGYGFGPAGIGWRYGPGAISRQTDKGLPRYVDDDNGSDDDFDFVIDEPDEKDTYIGPDGEELVEVETGVFRARIEGSFIRYRKVADYWQADLGNGTTLTFGSAADARIADATGARVYKWLLERSTDVNGNTIEYRYASFPDSNNQKYLREIRYGPGTPPWSTFYFVSFSYGQRPDWRVDYRSGFQVKTDQRLTAIHIGIQGASPAQCAVGDWNDDSSPDSLISRYELSYTLAQPNISHLRKVTRYGSDGVNYLPPLSFDYSQTMQPAVIPAEDEIITSVNAPSAVMDSSLVDLIDLNRDGLPDMLRTDDGQASHTCYLNLGVNDEAAARELTWSTGQPVGSSDGLALGRQLTEDRVSIADMDGDGIADLVHTTDYGDVYYYRNSGQLSWDDRQRMSIADYAPPAPFLIEDVKIADLDFDKRMDVVQSTDSGYTVWFNIEEGKYSRRIQVPGPRYQDQVLRFSQTGIHLADMNGDRLSDVVRIRPGAVIYAASTGHGGFAPTESIPIPGTVLEDGNNSQMSRARLEDVNNDGLADLVVERAVANELWCWLNEGTNSFSDRYTITEMPSQFSPDVAVRWADLNGNSTTDLIYGDSTAADRVRMLDIGEMLNGSAHANMLVEIRNGLGVTTGISYRSTTHHYLRDWAQGVPWLTTIPFPVQVVSEVATTTGLDIDTVGGIDRYVREYRYRDGYYEDREKQFRGFGEVLVIQRGDATSPTRVTRNGFFTGGPDGIDNDDDTLVDEVSLQNHREEDGLKGRVRFIEAKTATGGIFNRLENVWMLRTLPVSPADTEVRFAYMTDSSRLVYEHTPNPETIQTTYLYDDFGNTVETNNHGALSISGDELFSYTEYINDTTNWLLGKEQRSYQTGADHITVAETKSYYDGPDYVGLGYGSMTNGLLTRKQGWVEGSTWVDLVRNGYDSYGNITSTMSPNGYVRSVVYDSILHTYPELETIEVGGGNPDLSISAAYNIGLGTAASSSDFNGASHFFGHDVFGRVTTITRPGDTGFFPTLTFVYEMADPGEGLLYSYDKNGSISLQPAAPKASSITTKARETSGQPQTFDTTHYLDGLGRTLARVEEGEDGFIVKDAVLFNSTGTVHRRYPPYRRSSPDFLRPTATDPAVEIFYDAAGREIMRNNLPDADTYISSILTAYLPLQKLVTDENSHTRFYNSDGLERLISITVDSEGEAHITDFEHDPLGNLTAVTDAQNNIRAMEYDGLSRRILLLDPDRGRMEYTYDAAGNLTKTIDNKGQTTEYTYDGADRMLSENYLDAANIDPDVTYHYDTPSTDYPAAANLRARLSWVEDLSGATFFSYDARGNPVSTVKRIDDDDVTDYQSQVSYDSMNRPVTLIYPDGYTIQHTYNNRALLDSIPGIIEAIDYQPSGKRSSITYGNGLATRYTYDPRYRLTGLRTDFAAASANPVQDLSYSLDGVSNITAIDDNREIIPGDPELADQSFLYDDLDRLTRAEGPGYGRISFDYDKIGNMILKQSPDLPSALHIDNPLINLGIMAAGGSAGTSGRGVRLPGDQPGPHAISSTGSGLSFGYDDNGNMINSDGDTYSWDFRDRLTTSSSDGTTASYVYDYGGRRVIKKSAGHTAHYISNSYEIRDGEARKYVFDGDQRVALVVDAPLAGQAATQVIQLFAGWNCFSLNVDPTDPAIGTVLASLAGLYSQIWTYDNTSGQYLGHVPSENRSDFSEIHNGLPYLIRLDQAAVLTITGIKTADSINLDSGWNLISSFVDKAVPLTDALLPIDGSYQQVWSFSAAAGGWRGNESGQPEFLNELRYIRPAAAYWIEMDEPGQLQAVQVPQQIFFYHPDHLGSTNVMTDMGGTVVERSEFYPFGLLRHRQHSGFESAYKFTGKERDIETGLDYFEARYYHPVTSSFISVDPFEGDPVDRQGENRYAYVRNNPIRLIDPEGLSWIDAFATGLNVMDDTVETDTEKEGEEKGEEGKPTWLQGLTRIGFHALSMAIAGDFSDSDKLFELGLIGASFGLEVAQEETGWEELETIAGTGLGAAQMIKGIAGGDVGETIRSGLSTAESTAGFFGGEGYVQGASQTVLNFMDAANSVYGGTTGLIGIERKWFEPEKDKGKQAKSYWREKTGKDEAYQKLSPHLYDAYDFFGL